MAYKISDKAIIIESDGETILVAESFQYEDGITISNTDYTLSPTYISDYFLVPYTFQGEVSGYSSGGDFPYSVYFDTIDKFPFSSDANATDVGDITVARGYGSGQSSSSHGYMSGGHTWPPLGYYNIIDKFPFSVDGNATDVGDIIEDIGFIGGGQSSADNGYVSGGFNPVDAIQRKNTIQKFPFSSDTNASDVGDLTQARSSIMGQSSGTHGYSSGGNTPLQVNIIDKFPFSTDANATDVGDITVAKDGGAGQNSSSNGYTAGGTPFPAGTVIDKFPFSTDANATDVGDLTANRLYVAGQSSGSHGYSSGGQGGANLDIIDKFPFSADANASDVGDLTQQRNAGSGQQV